MPKNDYPLVAICLPVANLGEHSLQYLEACLSSIEDQDYPAIRVIISDHSEDDEIVRYLQEGWSDYEGKRGFEIVYTRFTEGRGIKSAAVYNTNNAINLAPDGCFVKPLFQDDLLKTPVAITRMVDAMRHEGKEWVGTGCNHIDEQGNDLNYNHPPRWVEGFQLAYGLNHIGSPSVVMFKKCQLRMDTNLSYLNDCEFYYRLGKGYGSPALINDMLVTIRMRPTSIGAMTTDEHKAQEQRYVQQKYGVT